MTTTNRSECPTTRFAVQLLALCCALAGAGYVGSALAVFGSAAGTYWAPAAAPERGKGVPYGPLTIYPSASLSFQYDDNYLRLPSNTVSSWVTTLAPSVLVEYLDGPNAYTFTYRTFKSWYSKYSEDDSWDHQFLAQAAMQLTERSDLALRGEFLLWHDPRGSDYPVGTVRDVVIDEAGRRVIDDNPDKWRSTRVGGVWGYGARGAKMRLELLAEQMWRDYTNNDQDIRDRNTTNLGGTLFYRIKPDVSLLGGVEQSRINYVNEPKERLQQDLSLDSTQRFYYGGAAWDITAKTTGEVRLGWLTKDFDESSRHNYNNFAWRSGIKWRPRTYSVVDLSTGRTTYEQTTGEDDYIKTTDILAAWTHAWNDRVSTTLSGGAAKDQYDVTDRDDKRYIFGINATYAFRPWLYLGAGYNHQKRNSNEPTFEFDANVYTLYIEASL